MFKKRASFILIILIINLFFGTTMFAAGTTTEKESEFAEKVKANIAKLGTGANARIEVRLKDGTKLKGYVGQINENAFVVVNDKTGISTEIPYSNAKQIKGKNNLNGKTIAGIAGIALLVLIVISLSRNNP